MLVKPLHLTGRGLPAGDFGPKSRGPKPEARSWPAFDKAGSGLIIADIEKRDFFGRRGFISSRPLIMDEKGGG